MGGNHGGHYGALAYSSTVTSPAMTDINVLSASLSLPLHDFQTDVAYGNEDLSSEGFNGGYDATQSGLVSFQHANDHHSQAQGYVDAYGFDGYSSVPSRDTSAKAVQQQGYVSAAGGLYPDHNTSPTVGTPGLHDKYTSSQATVPYDDGYQTFAGSADTADFYQQRFMENQKSFMKQTFDSNPQDVFTQSLGGGNGVFSTGEMEQKQSMYHPGVHGYESPVAYCGTDGGMYSGYHSAFYGGQGLAPCSSASLSFSHGVPASYRADLSIQMSAHAPHHLHRRTSLSIPTPPTPDG